MSPISIELRETALPWLMTLYQATNENVHLAILDELEALYVARLIGPQSIPTMSRMGSRLPLHTTGVGKVLLACQTEPFLIRYFSRVLERPTRYSIVSESKLRQQLADIRHYGFSRTHQEQTLGNASLAVPIRGPGTSALAAVGLVTHSVRADTARLVPLLQTAAERMAESLSALMERIGTDTFG